MKNLNNILYLQVGEKMRVYVFIIFIFHFSLTNAQTWSAVQGYDPRGFGGKFVTEMCVYNSKLYVAGEFDSIGIVRTPHVAVWDNIKWDSTSSGLNGGGAPNVMHVYNNELYTGGSQTIGWPTIAAYLLKWNGTSWAGTNYGCSGSCDRIYAMVVFKNELYIGGQFTELGGKTVNNIARWNGSTWNDVGGGVTFNAPTIVYSMAVYNNELYVGGGFGKAGNILVNNLAKWDGTKWDSLGVGSLGGWGGAVGNLLVDTVKNILYMTGGFNYVAGKYTDGFAQFDGVNWSAVGNAPVPAGTMCMYHGELYSSGQYTTTYGGETLRNLARWDGTTWHAVGTGMGTVGALTMAVYNDDLYMGGPFTEVNGDTNIKYLAKWSMPVGVEEYKVQSSKFKVYPNPAHNELIVELEENIQNKKLQLCVFDNVGKELLRQTIHQKKETLTISHLAKGIYHAKLIAENNVTLAVKKFVVQ